MPPSPSVRFLAALTFGAALAATPAITLAHVELVSSDPEAGTNLDAAPTQVTLTFDGELDPDGSRFSVTDHHGEEVGSGAVDLGVADRNVLAAAVNIDEPGVYRVAWTVVGADGHEVSGSFSFGYATDEEISERESGGHGHESPDTALSVRGASVLTAVGALLGLLAGVVAVRRQIVR